MLQQGKRVIGMVSTLGGHFDTRLALGGQADDVAAFSCALRLK